MGILSAARRLFAAPEQRAVDISALLSVGHGTAAGIAVGADNFMRCTPARVAVEVRAEALAMLTPHLNRRLAGGGRERVNDHPVASLLTDLASPWQTASAWRLMMQTALDTHGNAFAFVNRDGAGRPVEIIQLDSRAVSVEVDPATQEPRYFVSAADGSRREYDRRDILHVHLMGTRPYLGNSPVQDGREAIGLALVLEQHAAGLFGRGARPSGVFKYAKSLGSETLAKLRASFDSTHSGGANAGRPMILEDGMTWEQTQLSSVDAQFLELRKFQVAEVSRLWRVPLHLLNDLERTTHNNAEHMGQQFLSFCLLPLLRLWEDALSMTLLSPDERKEYYVEFLTDEIARADLGARFTAYSQAINAGIYNPNEIRAFENRGPYSGGETYMRPSNTAPAPPGGNTPSKTEAGNV